LVGINHVGLGSDYDGVGPTLPVGMEDVSTYPALVAELLRRGYTDEDVRKVLGGNLMRVWTAVEAAATD
jgi:membrane dipeptidase